MHRHYLITILLGRNAYRILEYLIECAHGTKTNFGSHSLEQNVILRVTQQTNGFINPVIIDILSKILLSLFVDDLRQISPVRPQQIGHPFLCQQVLLVNLLFLHQSFQTLKQRHFLLTRQGRSRILFTCRRR